MSGDGLSFQNYLSVRSAYSPTFDASGSRVAFLTDITGIPQVWSVELTGGWPHQLTFFDERVTSVQWAPVGSKLVFGMDTGGNERHQLYWLSIGDAGTIVPLTDSPEVMHVYGGWSPDGKSISYASNRRDAAHFDVYVHEVPEGEAKIVHQEDGSNTPVAWSPDGKKLIVSHADTSAFNQLILVDLESEESRQLTDSDQQAAYSHVGWSRDGSSLYFLTNKGREFMALSKLVIESGDIEPVVELDWDIEAMALSSNGRQVAYVVNEAGYSKLMVRELASGAEYQVAGLPKGTLQNARGPSSVTWGPEGHSLGITVNGASHNPDIWVCDVNIRVCHQLTFSDTGGVSRRSFVEPELISFKTFDEREIPALLYTPKGTEADGSNRVIVHVHGGPESQERPAFNPVYQYLIQRGYCILAPNVRGSTGYGQEYSHLDDVEKRMDSVHDLKYAWQWLVDEKWGDPKKIAVMGGSYGGFMTLSAITTYPDLWAVAVELYGIGDFLAFLKNTSSYRRKLRASEYGDPRKNAKLLKEISPINHIDQIKAPLLVLHGEQDPRVPISETEHMVAALEKQGNDVELIRFEDEGHGFVKRANRLVAYTSIANFLDKHLPAE